MEYHCSLKKTYLAIREINPSRFFSDIGIPCEVDKIMLKIYEITI